METINKKNKKIGKAWIVHEPDVIMKKANARVLNYGVWQVEYTRKKFCHVSFRANHKIILNYTLCIIIVNGSTVEYWFKVIPKCILRLRFGTMNFSWFFFFVLQRSTLTTFSGNFQFYVLFQKSWKRLDRFFWNLHQTRFSLGFVHVFCFCFWLSWRSWLERCHALLFKLDLFLRYFYVNHSARLRFVLFCFVFVVVTRSIIMPYCVCWCKTWLLSWVILDFHVNALPHLDTSKVKNQTVIMVKCLIMLLILPYDDLRNMSSFSDPHW